MEWTAVPKTDLPRSLLLPKDESIQSTPYTYGTKYYFFMMKKPPSLESLLSERSCEDGPSILMFTRCHCQCTTAACTSFPKEITPTQSTLKRLATLPCLPDLAFPHPISCSPSFGYFNYSVSIQNFISQACRPEYSVELKSKLVGCEVA